MNNYNQNPIEQQKRASRMLWVVLLLVIVVLSGVGYIFKDRFLGGESISTAPYQAVFLTNGQVYFGSISKINSDYVVLKNIYYLQANDSLQVSSSQSQPFTLIKLGKELHGPTDIMYINKQQILFYEDLRDDSSVVKTIQNYKP